MKAEWRNRIIETGEAEAREFTAHELNARRHPQSQRAALTGSLDAVGWVAPVIVSHRSGKLLDGHARVEEALARSAASLVPFARVDVSESEERTILLSLDPISGMAEYDPDVLAKLASEFESTDDALRSLVADLLDANPLLPQAGGGGDEFDTTPDDGPTRSKTGDLWIVGGKHRVMCGDATKAADVEKVMSGERAQLCHADPPYGMGKESDGIANDNLYREKLDAFQISWWTVLRSFLEDNASAYIWGNAEDLWRLWYVGGLKDSERLTLRNEIVWAKGSAGAAGVSLMGAEGVRQYPGETERCLFFMLGEQGFNNNADNYWEGWEHIRSALFADCETMGWGPQDIERICGVGMYGHWFTKSQWCFIPEHHYRKLQAAAREHDAFKREHDELKREHDELKREFYATRAHFDNTHDNMTDVWSFPRVTGDDRYNHVTPKPVDLIRRIIKSSAPEGGTVFDPFLGSGTTLIAAHRTGRTCYGIEIEPKYCDVILRRAEAEGLSVEQR